MIDFAGVFSKDPHPKAFLAIKSAEHKQAAKHVSFAFGAFLFGRFGCQSPHKRSQKRLVLHKNPINGNLMKSRRALLYKTNKKRLENSTDILKKHLQFYRKCAIIVAFWQNHTKTLEKQCFAGERERVSRGCGKSALVGFHS